MSSTLERSEQGYKVEEGRRTPDASPCVFSQCVLVRYRYHQTRLVSRIRNCNYWVTLTFDRYPQASENSWEMVEDQNASQGRLTSRRCPRRRSLRVPCPCQLKKRAVTSWGRWLRGRWAWFSTVKEEGSAWDRETEWLFWTCWGKYRCPRHFPLHPVTLGTLVVHDVKEAVSWQLRFCHRLYAVQDNWCMEVYRETVEADAAWILCCHYG